MTPESAAVILLAEDDDGHATLIQRNLTPDNMIKEIIRVRDGQEAIDYIRRNGPHAGREYDGPLVILLDINMPRLDGFSVLEHIKGNPDTHWLPVIMLTTTGNPAEVRRCYELGCNAYVTKPIDYAEFVSVLGRLKEFLRVITLVPEDKLWRGFLNDSGKNRTDSDR